MGKSTTLTDHSQFPQCPDFGNCRYPECNCFDDVGGIITDDRVFEAMIRRFLLNPDFDPGAMIGRLVRLLDEARAKIPQVSQDALTLAARLRTMVGERFVSEHRASWRRKWIDPDLAREIEIFVAERIHKALAENHDPQGQRASFAADNPIRNPSPPGRWASQWVGVHVMSESSKEALEAAEEWLCDLEPICDPLAVKRIMALALDAFAAARVAEARGEAADLLLAHTTARVAEARAQERERCAEIAQNSCIMEMPRAELADTREFYAAGFAEACGQISSAIRALAEPQET